MKEFCRNLLIALALMAVFAVLFCVPVSGSASGVLLVGLPCIVLAGITMKVRAAAVHPMDSGTGKCGESIILQGVTDEANKAWAVATPYAEIKATINNPNAYGAIKPDKFYMVNITEMVESPADVETAAPAPGVEPPATDNAPSVVSEPPANEPPSSGDTEPAAPAPSDTSDSSYGSSENSG